MTGDATTPPDEIESLESGIRSRLDKLDLPPYLNPDSVRELLEEIAYHRRGVTTGVVTMVEVVAASRRWDWPPELGDAERREIITRLIGGSGILVPEDDDFRFARQTVQEYLAAYYIVQRHPRGPRWWQPQTGKYLAPRTIRSPEAGAMLFLVALWWQEQKAKPSVEWRLRRLLRVRYHDANIGFVIELIQRNLIPGSKIPNPTINFLLRKLTEGQQDEGRWVVTVERLYLLDPMKAIAELERVVDDLGRTITPGRKRAAVDMLMKDDPERGARNLEILAHSSLDKTGEPRDWLYTAIWIGKYNCELLSERTMLRLTEKPDMGDLRADAAIRANSFERMCELIEREDTLSDQARLSLSQKVCDQTLMEPYGQKWPMAVTAMQQFAQTAREDGTPLQIATMVKPHDQPVALRIADDVAWNEKIDSGERLNAVIWIGEIAPAQAVLKLEQLSEDSSVTDKVRLTAARRIVTHHDGPITAVVKLGDNPKLDHNYRIEAAEFVGQRDHVTGARLYISIAKTCELLPYPQLNLLRKAYKLDPGPAADALAEFAEKPHIPGKIRLDAIEIARQKLDEQRTIEVYITIAKTTDNDSALTSAREVMKINLDAGRRLMGELAADPGKVISFRLSAALEAGTYGTPVLKDLMSTAQSYTVRFEVARALWDIGRKAEAEPTLRELVKTSGAGKVRIDAARTLPDAVNALITITNDRREKDETIRFDAGLEAEKENPKKGRKALRELAGDPDISEALREKIRRYLNE